MTSQYRILIAVIIVVVLGIVFNAPSTVFSRSSAEILSPIAVGADHACAIKPDGEVYCWGTNYAGQLGYGYGLQESLTPI